MTEKTTYDRIVETADTLFYERGFEHTSFADIAQVVGISRGNFYHHFKSKDELLDAVINARLSNTRTILDKWEADGESPSDRIRSFIHILITNRVNIKRHGCPVGSLCAELAKLKHPSRTHANKLFTLFRTWLRGQFTQMGRKADADQLAMHLLARSQGIATLANAFDDAAFIKQEVDQLLQWLNVYLKPHPPQGGQSDVHRST